MSNIIENPRGGCVLAGINSTLSAMHRVCPILHSGPGCCMQTSAGEQPYSGNRAAPFLSSVSLPSSNMLEREVVFGGVGKLRSTVEGALEIIDAEAYFVLCGCTAGIIGDDILSVTDDFQARGLPVYAIDTPGFQGDSLLGYEVAWTNLINQVVEPADEKDPTLVNLFGIVPYHDPFWSGNIEELTRILERLGLRVNTFCTRDQGISEVKGAARASLNIIVNPWLFKGPAEKFERKFGVPSYRYPGLPVGATDTTEFVRGVAAALELDSALVQEVIDSEEAYVYGYLEQGIGVVSWKRFAVVADANNAVGMTRYLANDFSFTPELVIVTDGAWRPRDKELILRRLTELEFARPPKVEFINDQYLINEALRGNDEISLLIGSSFEYEVAGQMDTQFIQAAFPLKDRFILNRCYAGYRGGLTFTEDIYDNL
jgi:nitrogenase molybdenum-iron protein beta chain